MRVIHLSLTDFRNYASAEVDLRPGPNLIIGRNGQGKTNLIEAIGYFSSLRSHRVSGDAALIRAGHDVAVARLRVAVLAREASLEIELRRGSANRAQVNRNSVRPRELLRWFSSVLFAPEDLAMVRGEPSVRRRFLDDAVVARNPAMSSVMNDYERVVRQRTALLKSLRHTAPASGLADSLSVWDDRLVTLGSRIIEERRALVAALREPLSRSYSDLIEQDHGARIALAESLADDPASPTDFAAPAGISVGVSRETGGASSGTVSRETIEHSFREALERVRRQERERAVTLIGPHRDDLLLELNGLPVKGFASHGESWSFALSMKLALAALLREESAAGDPVIVLDDVFAELDSGRRERLMAAVGDYEQVIVTAAVEEDVPAVSDWHTIRIGAGSVLGAEPALGGGSAPGAGSAPDADSLLRADESAENPEEPGRVPERGEHGTTETRA